VIMVNAKYIYGHHPIASKRVLDDLRNGVLVGTMRDGSWDIPKDHADSYIAWILSLQSSRSPEARHTRNVAILKRLEAGASLAETGREFGLSRTRVAQIQEKALRRLRHPANAKYRVASELPLVTRHSGVPASALSRDAGVYEAVPVRDLDMSVRTSMCLANASITTVGDLVQKSKTEMLRVPNLGRKSLNEVEEILSAMGLRLRGEDE